MISTPPPSWPTSQLTKFAALTDDTYSLSARYSYVDAISLRNGPAFAADRSVKDGPAASQDLLTGNDSYALQLCRSQLAALEISVELKQLLARRCGTALVQHEFSLRSVSPVVAVL